jgi:acetylornithine deacetylase/succinyl-diaminopimelate desuccinylase-like protein
MRLVPNMMAGEVLPMIRWHVDRAGFLEVKIRVLEAGYPWAKIKASHPAAQALMRMYREFWHEPEIRPHIAGSAPFAMFSSPPLNLPFVESGLGHGGLAHSPNE